MTWFFPSPATNHKNGRCQQRTGAPGLKADLCPQLRAKSASCDQAGRAIKLIAASKNWRERMEQPIQHCKVGSLDVATIADQRGGMRVKRVLREWDDRE